MISIRRTYVIVEERREEAGQPAIDRLRRTAVVAVVSNPCAGRFVADLKPMIEASVDIGHEMAEMMLAAFGQYEIQSYGKGGIRWRGRRTGARQRDAYDRLCQSVS